MLAFILTAMMSWFAVALAASTVDNCSYVLSELNQTASGLDALLLLTNLPCRDDDIESLKLSVSYETDERLHVRIVDAKSQRYEVPSLIFPRPHTSILSNKSKPALVFSYRTSPFSFTITRQHNGEVLFSTESTPIVYRHKHIQVTTRLPRNANIYGLGESTDQFRINLGGNGTRRTLWARDAYGTRKGTNLYGSHPIYYDHRPNGTHGVFLLNSNGMDITLRGESLQYDLIGGVLDFYFLAGPSPVDVAKQYSNIAGLPAMIPYWSLGFQQCRYGYSNYVEVAEVIANYSKAGIPLETMWTDIDYMYKRRTFTLDPDYFPLKRMQEIVKYLHSNGQRYVMMIDPAIAYQPGDHGAFDRGMDADVFLKEKDGKVFQGVVWAGVSAYPDWFHPNAEAYWTQEIKRFFHPESGIDIDGIWIDMNEPSNFALPCAYPCQDPTLSADAQATASKNPPPRQSNPPPKNASLPLNLKKVNNRRSFKDSSPYEIHNAVGALDKGTIRTDLVHHNGLTEYDVHNLYGTHMSLITHKAMLSRRSTVRPQIVTRSTFAGAGSYAAHWTGDNLSDWPHYLSSITEIMSFASLFQVPLVGADVCGYGGNTNEELCARWASLGAFYPFYRNHNELGMISQEFYRWESVAKSARNAIVIRYSLLDYFYTHMRRQSLTGEPAIKPLWFVYPGDPTTFPIDTQFFFGDSILVSPVVEANSTSVKAYFPESRYVEFSSWKMEENSGFVELKDVDLNHIPVHIRPGSILPIREVVSKESSELALTTPEVRNRSFEITVLPNSSASAKGSLYLDDGESLETPPEATAEFEFLYSNRVLHISGRIGSNLKGISTSILRWRFLGLENVKQIKGIRVIDNPELEAGASLLPVHIDLEQRSLYVEGHWKLMPGMKVALIYN